MEERISKKIVSKRHLNRKISEAVKLFFSFNDSQSKKHPSAIPLESNSAVLPPSHFSGSLNLFSNQLEQQPTTSTYVETNDNPPCCSSSTLHEVLPLPDSITGIEKNSDEKFIDFERFSSDDDEDETSNETTSSEKLQIWSLDNKINLKAVSELLKVLSPYHPELPIDRRTLLLTPRSTDVKVLENG